MKHQPTFRPWVLVVKQDDGPPVILGYKREEEAYEALFEVLGVDEDEVDATDPAALEHLHDGTGWFCEGKICATVQRIEYPVE